MYFLIEVLSILNFIVFLLLSIALSTLVERKVMASMQRRRGPNVAGIFGFLQPVLDGLKLFLKENIVPKDADLLLFLTAPVFTFFCSIKIWGAIPFSESDIPVYSTSGVLYILIILSIGAYGIIFAGWSSNSKYAFLGGLRSTAQMISYEICLSFIILTICLMSQSLDFHDIVEIQKSVWFIIPLFPLWFIFVISGLAETNRAPFDLPEAEAELVAGYNVEYSAIPFALFFLGEYSNILAFGAISSIFFFGGWLPMFGLNFIPSAIWMGLKITFHMFLFVWIRATLPRYRYDQLMKLGWKVLLPISLIIFLIVILMMYQFSFYISYYY